MSAGSTNTGRFAMRTGKRRCSSAPIVLWNSSTVAHDTRWDLDLPDRDGVFALYGGRARSDSSTGSAAGSMLPTRYFYELSIRHEDMHVEALAYTRQTLGYARAAGARRPGAPIARARGPAMSHVPGGHWRLGSTPPTASSSTTRNGRTRSSIAPFRIAKAPVTNAEFAAFVEARRLSPAGILERRRAGPGASARRAERPVYWLPQAAAAAGRGAAMTRSGAAARRTRR